MSINSVAGSNAYAFVQKAIDNANTSGSSGVNDTDSTGSSGFSDMVSDALKSTFNSVKASETVSANAMSGKASLTDVVTAVNGADVALKSVVAIRDKVIGAYQDIIKMPM